MIETKVWCHGCKSFYADLEYEGTIRRLRLLCPRCNERAQAILSLERPVLDKAPRVDVG